MSHDQHIMSHDQYIMSHDQYIMSHDYHITQGHVLICMELLDSSMGQVSDIVYNKLHHKIPEEVLGRMTVAVSYRC